MTSQNLIPVKERDFLEEDLTIRGQKYVCLSFLSPDDAIRNKNIYVLNKFLKDISRDVSDLLKRLSEKFKDSLDVQDMIKNLKDRYGYLENEDSLQSQFEAFSSTNPQLDDEYLQENNFQTCVRGIKVRGAYETIIEAENRVKQIQKFDKKFHVYIGAVGCWCPWSPNPDNVSDNVYSETQLNTLMKSYQENIDRKDELHKLRKEYLMEDVRKPQKDDQGAPSLVVEEETTE
jgi:hypothetical protein